MNTKKLAQLDWVKRLPNALTLGRLAIMILIIPLYLPGIEALNVVCAILFLIASLSDYFDGWIARKFDLVSKFGATFDHIADKILSTTCLILLGGSGAVYTIIVIILVGREITISGLRLLAIEQNVSLNVSSFGKAKTVALDLGIGCLFVDKALTFLPFREIGMLSIWVAVGLSVYSGYLYIHAFWPNLKSEIQGT